VKHIIIITWSHLNPFGLSARQPCREYAQVRRCLQRWYSSQTGFPQRRSPGGCGARYHDLFHFLSILLLTKRELVTFGKSKVAVDRTPDKKARGCVSLTLRKLLLISIRKMENISKKYGFDPACPVRNVLDRFGDKWSILIIIILGEMGKCALTSCIRPSAMFLRKC